MKKFKLWIVAACAVALVLLVVMVFNNLTGHLVRIAASRTRAMATAVANECVMKVLGENDFGGSLVSAKKDTDGTVYFQANTLIMNTLTYSICELVQKQLREKGEYGVSVPLGAALGNDLFASSGPDVNVKVHLSGNVQGTYSSVFESSGINQTRHCIIMTICTNMDVLLFSQKSSICVDTDVTVYEGIIVGNVPDFYFNTPSSRALDLVP